MISRTLFDYRFPCLLGRIGKTTSQPVSLLLISALRGSPYSVFSPKMAEQILTLEDLVNSASSQFENYFKDKCQVAACAPGRVNLIGEHVDYNGGFVLPMAIPLYTVVVGKRSESGICRLITSAVGADDPKFVEFELPANGKELKAGSPKWANYVKGVVANFSGELCAFDAAIVTSVPLGGGLSSSASLEVAMYTFLESLTGNKANSLQDKALACQKAEHDYPGMPCGIMDQFITVMGRKEHALLIDCRSLDAIHVPLRNSTLLFLVINSNVRHELTGGEYAERRQHCEDAANILGVHTLRDASLKLLEDNKDKLSEEGYRRVRHVISEIARTSDAAEALKKDDFVKFGELMVASHNSLRDDFEVSCPELDSLVDLATKVNGVYGSRMTGGGFGGCTVTLAESKAVNDVMVQIKKNYKGKPTFYIFEAVDGAHAISL